MNIDKHAMEVAWNNRTDEKYMNELMNYFDQMAHFFANKFKIRSYYKQDYIQESIIYAFKALEKYQPSKKSTPFSYFYKVFYTGFLYLMRREKMKSDKRPKFCSYESFSDSLSRDNLEYEDHPFASPDKDEDSFFFINEECFEREAVSIAVRAAKKLHKEGIKTSKDRLISIILKGMNNK